MSPAACEAMLAILRAQAFNEGIPAGLPADVVVAHKTGSITDLYHDAAVVEPPGAVPYVLVVLTQGLEETRVAPALVASIAREVHEVLGATRRLRALRRLLRTKASSSRSAAASRRFDTDEHTSGPKPFRASSA